MANLPDKMAEHNLDLLKSGNFSDAEIFCHGRTWKVHKLILRSRCAWFEKAFANNWQEAQTGQIHLEQEQPDQIDDLLRFIYSGRYIPDLKPNVQCISASRLGNKVSLWRTADFFLLPDLKKIVYDYLFYRLVVTLRFFHAFNDGIHQNIVKDQNLDVFFIDLPSAVEKVYECPAARELQKLFAIFACGLREHLPDGIRQDLNKRIPAFQQDVSFVLTILHFPHATNEPSVAAMLEDPYVCARGQGNIVYANNISSCPLCSALVAHGISNVACTGPDTILDPFSFGTIRWDGKCASEGIKRRLLGLLKAWS